MYGIPNKSFIESDIIEPISAAHYVENVKNARLARAYVPFQKLEKLFEPEEGLKMGSMFPELTGL